MTITYVKHYPVRPPELNKLPSRLKQYITELERVAAQAHEQEATAVKTLVSLRPLDGPDTYLPSKTRVSFRLGPLDHERINVRLAPEGGLEIASEIGGLVVYPHVSNVVTVRLVNARGV